MEGERAAAPRPKRDGARDPAPVERLEREANGVALRLGLGLSAASAPSRGALAAEASLHLDTPGPRPAGDGGMRRSVGDALGYDFAGVRFHAGDGASAIARHERAHAVTTGPDVHFAPGRFRPDLPLGRALIAHELAHVAQLGAAAPVEGREPALSAAPPGARLRLESCGCGSGCGTGPAQEGAEGPAQAEGAQEGPAAEAAETTGGAATTPVPATVPAPPTPPEGFPEAAATHYATIEEAVGGVNERLPTFAAPGVTYTPLDPDWIRAMMMVETTMGTEPRRLDPMQVSNAGDPALGVMQAGGEFSSTIDPGIEARLRGRESTPRRGGRWAYEDVPEAARMDADTSVVAGVTWLAVKAAQWRQYNQEDTEAEVRTHTVVSGDTFEAVAAANGTTVATLRAHNPGVDPRKLRLGMELQYRPATMVWRIHAFRSWEDAAVRYNGGGNPDYLEEVQAAYEQIRAARTPAPAAPPP